MRRKGLLMPNDRIAKRGTDSLFSIKGSNNSEGLEDRKKVSIPLFPIAEGERILTICNACRYCEGYCAVFPAMERRMNFAEADLNYLANLCHNCAECYYACQYAPPHEFAVNVPQTFAEIRAQSYEKYAGIIEPPLGFHGPLSMLYWLGTRQSFYAWCAWFVLFVVIVILPLGAPTETGFYREVPHGVMVGLFGFLSFIIFSAHLGGFLRFWRETGESLASSFTPSALLRGIRDALTLKNLSSHGAGCTYPNQHHSNARRVFHHFTFYGFGLCFASTTVAAIYHFSGRIAPYPYFSAPVILGTLGGIGLLIGPAGLYALKKKRDPAIADAKQDRGDTSLIALLMLASATGLALLAFRETRAMPILLKVHLGVVLGLFLTLPYGKFVHGIYRTAALVRSALESARSQNQGSGQSH